MIGVVVLLRQLLRLQEALAHLGEDPVSAAEEGVRSLSPGRPRLVWHDGRRGAAITTSNGVARRAVWKDVL